MFTNLSAAMSTAIGGEHLRRLWCSPPLAWCRQALRIRLSIWRNLQRSLYQSCQACQEAVLGPSVRSWPRPREVGCPESTRVSTSTLFAKLQNRLPLSTHLWAASNAWRRAGAVNALSFRCSTTGSPRQILGNAFQPVVGRTSGSSSDSIKLNNSRSKVSRTSSVESRVRRPWGRGLDASPTRTPLNPKREVLTPDFHWCVCVASTHRLLASA